MQVRRADLVMVDLQMPGLGGLDVLRAMRAAQPECQVVLMTGNATIDSAIEAVKAGALDYVSKPFDFARLRGLLTSVREGQKRRARLLEADAEVARQFEFHGMIGRSPVMHELFDSIRRLAPHARTVLIAGETGTGKELVARALHELGTRSRKRLVTLNCSAVVENLFESELFGHVRGAFTGAAENKVGLFEHADGGTIFLDEAGELPMPLQAKLLRAVEYGEVQRVGSLQPRQVDVAVIAATNRDLRAEAAAGRFRSDLYFRLGIIEIFLPPLRERREDIPLLTATFIRGCASRLKKTITGITPAAERYLQQAPWPGNIRELRNVIERACIQCDSQLLGERDLQSTMPPPCLPARRVRRPPRRTCSRRRSANKSAASCAKPAATRPRRRACSASAAARCTAGSIVWTPTSSVRGYAGAMCDLGHAHDHHQPYGFLVDTPQIRALIAQTERLTAEIPDVAARVEALRPSFEALLHADGWLPDSCAAPDDTSRMGGGIGQYALYRAEDQSLCLFSLVRRRRRDARCTITSPGAWSASTAAVRTRRSIAGSTTAAIRRARISRSPSARSSAAASATRCCRRPTTSITSARSRTCRRSRFISSPTTPRVSGATSSSPPPAWSRRSAPATPTRRARRKRIEN
jgi:DNA-binding NtrC family response regulator